MYIIYKHTVIKDCPHKGWAYIGQTIQEPKRRWKSGSSYKDQIFGRAIKKYGWNNFSHIIIKDKIKTVEEANYWEEYYIAKYHTYTRDPKCRGYNVSPGGFNRDNYGKIVLQLDIHKNILAEYKSICAASRAVNTSPDRISRCCNFPQICHTVKGYFWCFKENYKVGLSIPKHTKVKIYQLDRHKNIINTFNSISEAGLYLHIAKNNNIKKCLKSQNNYAYGYYWCKVEDYNKIKINIPTRNRELYCIEANKSFIGLKKAANFCKSTASIVSNCCKNKAKTVGGYHWMYKDEYEDLKKKGELENEKGKSEN